MKGCGPIWLAYLLFVSVSLLVGGRITGDPQWLTLHLPAAGGSDGILWQVQATFLSVGFAGLAIAAQLFNETPLAIGASRRRVLKHIGADLFVGVGLAANAVAGIETIWLPSGLGVWVAAIWFVATIYMLVRSTNKLMSLFSNPSLLDEVVRISLIESLSARHEGASRRHAEATKQIEGLVLFGWSNFGLRSSTVTLRIPVPQSGFVVKAIKPRAVKQARDLLAPRTAETRTAEDQTVDDYTLPRLILDVEPGERTRLHGTAFRVSTHEALDAARQGRITRLLQSSIEFESPQAVTPDEETGREIANLQDAVATSIRAGAFATAERALELLGQVLRGVWMIRQDGIASPRRAMSARREWLFRSIGEVEQDAVFSSRAAGMFVGQATARALEARSAGSTEYVDECLRSFTRIWLDVLQQPGAEFDQLPARIVVCVQNLATSTNSAEHDDLSIRATWAMVELVKLALDAHEPEVAVLAADALVGLLRNPDRDAPQREHIRAGQLVLAGWLEYLADKRDDRNPESGDLRELVTPGGTWAEIFAARNVLERGETRFSRWDWWEVKFSGSSHAQFLEFSHYIDVAQLAALALSYGSLPPTEDQQTADDYRRFLRLVEERGDARNAVERELKESLKVEIARWTSTEEGHLAVEPLSDKRIADLRTALETTLEASSRLTDNIPHVGDVPENADASRPILGMNFRIPRLYLVDRIFNHTYADPADLGQVIARGFTDGEELKIVQLLRTLQDRRLELTVPAIRAQITELDDDAEHYVLLTPYGGLVDLDAWYATDFREALKRVNHLETSSLDAQVILFDARSTVVSCRKPEEKEGLVPVGDTSIAIGVFEDVRSTDEPQVRLEVGEYFVVWPGDEPRVVLFGADPITAGGAETR